ncbi:MAG: cysteine hydrolase, partial [Actinobacteria bacterium]
MISQFSSDTALLLVDVQKGVDVVLHWGGPTGRRNNPDAESYMLRLLGAFRHNGLTIAYTRHDSREKASPLKFSLPTGAQKEGFEVQPTDIVVEKDVN